MRTPPPVLPAGQEDSPGYKRTWFDREGPDAGLRLKAGSYGATVTAITFAGIMLFAAQGAGPSFGTLFGGLIVSLILGAVTYVMTAKLSDGAGAVAQSFIQPSGNSTPYEQTFSYQEAMAARGDVPGALESYEAIISEQPLATAPRLRAAEHYARGNRNPVRAAELFREVRITPGVTTRDALYSTSRLVDLYDGPLADPGRALVELRRIIEQYPQSRAATQAREALPGLKRRLGEVRNS
jgi:hypothetical protein